MSRLAVLATTGCVAFAIVVSAQQPSDQVVFRSGTDVVDVEVSVLDKQRMPVRDLTADDFTVLEDGKVRPIVAFTPVELPAREMPSAPWMAGAAPDVQTNNLPREGRLVVILFDQSISFSQAETARRVAEAAIDQLRPGDLAAITYSLYGVPQNFTADRERLRRIIRQPLAALPAEDDRRPADCLCGVCSIEAIANVAEAIQDVRQRRKVLLYIGSRLPIQSGGPCAGAQANARRRAFRAAEVGNLTVHTFDPSGVATHGMSASATSAPRITLADLRRRDNLKVLPQQTGGRAISSNDPEMMLGDIFRESGSYYILGFRPSHADGKFHKISVRVDRRDVVLQARRGYYAAGGPPRATPKPPDAVPARLYAALAGLWPQTDLPLTLSAAPIARTGLRDASVAVTIGVRQTFLQDDPRSTEQTSANVLIGAFDRNGRSLGYEQQTLAVTPRHVAGGTFEYETAAQLTLKPGRYEIRAAVEDSALDRTGSVYTYVDVPNFYDSYVSLSGILFDARPAIPAAAAPGFRELLHILPTTRRQFAGADRVTAHALVYQGLRRATIPGYLVAEIRDEDDRRVFQQENRLLPTDFVDNRAVNYSLDVPIDRLRPGQYLLSIEARHGTAIVTRHARFSVR